MRGRWVRTSFLHGERETAQSKDSAADFFPDNVLARAREYSYEIRAGVTGYILQKLRALRPLGGATVQSRHSHQADHSHM